MKIVVRVLWAAIVCAAVAPSAFCEDASSVRLPDGVKAVWDASKALHETTPTRERISINGLWRWQPARSAAEIPAANWGYFKVPGCWPGISDYQQKDCQTVFAHPSWKNDRLGGVTAAWYQREIAIPESWAGRRIALGIESLNSHAAIYVDGKKADDVRFPGGEVDLTSLCRPGATHVLTIRITAMPLKEVLLSFVDTASARQVKGTVARRGLCGDVFLTGTPRQARIVNVNVDTSVRKWQIALDAALDGLAAEGEYSLRAEITDGGRNVKRLASPAFKGRDLKEGRVAFAEPWKPEKLWDLTTPQNTYRVSLSLLDAGGKVLDTAWPVRVGFREFWIDGRDFYLNGSRIFLSAVPLDNAQIGAAQATYASTRESLERLKGFGINFVYTHNYGCEPGSHLSFSEILNAADDAGVLVAFSQPHFSHYDWKQPDADRKNGYAQHAETYVRKAQNHPSVVAYSMSHNAAGYSDDMNPDMIDGIQNPRESWASNNAKLAARAEAIVKHLDPGRIVYHHASGNLGVMHTSNFYPNFVPVQELSDWFGHWATQGVKPVFTCEYGAPFTWDWTMYRGWYKGQRSFGSARVPWEFCVAEWNAQFFGDRAYRISEPEKTNLRWEAKQFRAGRVWNRWDYPNQVGSTRFDEQYPVFALYLTDNWRAFRTWGVSAISPWEHGHFWKLRDGVDKRRKELKVDWENLQRPGFSPDYVNQQYERMDLAFERADWIPTAAAESLIRNNRPLLAYLAGKPARFTSKDHNFLPAETVEKQIVVINNSRQTVSCDCQWSLDLPGAQRTAGSRKLTVPTGQQDRVPVGFTLPESLAQGTYELRAEVRFSTGETQADCFSIHVLPRPAETRADARIALFDPKGATGKQLTAMKIPYQSVKADSDLAPYDLLIVGKSALTLAGPAPDLARVREGLKVLVFEQTSEVLEKRFGFRVVEYGLRQVFPRVPDHPILAGIAPEHLRDWRGEATILAPQLKYETRPAYGPTIKWCDIPVTRVWRCGNQGNVASVLIEKPARGDFLPVLDGGYSLQYSPLLEYRDGKGVVLFCQMDVSHRTEADPTATALTRNVFRYLSAWKPAPRRKALYVGDAAGKSYFESAGLIEGSYEGGKPAADQVLIVGPGGGKALGSNAAAIGQWLKTGGHLLAIGIDEQEIAALGAVKVRTKKAEHIASFFEPGGAGTLLAGIGPADVHNRDPRELPLVASGATVLGDGILARAENANVVFCQMAPWQFDGPEQNLRRTRRRAAVLVQRVLANMGVAAPTPVLARFGSPMDPAKPEKRWLDGFYLDRPEEWDDPYRFFRW